MSDTVNWFGDRPLHIETVCARLREAVEERENFFHFDPHKCASNYPLDLPSRPYDAGGVNMLMPSGALRKFAYNLNSRIRALARSTFAPEKLGKFSEFNPALPIGAESSFSSAEICDGIMADFLQVDPADFRMAQPLDFSNMKFFNACAKFLNDYIRYPQPIPFSDTSGSIFGWDCQMALKDLKNGTAITGTYRTDGIISYRSAAGSSRMLTSDTPAEWIKDDLQIHQYGHYFYYDNSRSAGAGYADLTGNFQFQVSARWSLLLDNVTDITENTVSVYTLAPGGDTPLHLPEIWRQRISDTLSGSDRYYRMRVRIFFNSTNILIKLTPDNYPQLPYKYLT